MNVERIGLAKACERALVAGARTERAGTRQQLRAAARGFVRRHARDSGYLRWVLRSVGASSAVAVALLGLGAAPAQAKLPPFQTPQTTASDAGTASATALGDLDGDGDLDLASGTKSGIFAYLENAIVKGALPVVEQLGGNNPLAGKNAGAGESTPALGDLDGDGDLDLVSGEFGGSFHTYYLPEPGPGLLLGAGLALLGWFERVRRRRQAPE